MDLNEMTLEELWQLFPIVLAPYNPLWKDMAEEEMKHLTNLLSDFAPVITHIGSTSIPGILAKPIIDILVEIPEDIEWEKIKEKMVAKGYICMSESSRRISFNKGYTPDGYEDKVFHIHFHRVGDNDEVLFRDYLRSHHEEAEKYTALKLSLLPRFRNDRDGYTSAKTEFVNYIVKRARNEI